MNAVIYGRYSSDRQKDESIEAQVRACKEYAEKHGLIITRVYEDRAISAKNDKRPEFQRLMRDADRRQFDIVLIHKYNRFARRITDHVKYEERLNNNGIDLIAVAEDFGTGKESIIMKSLMRAMSEYYVVDLGDETRKGLKETALEGLHNGGYAPFGYDVVDQKYVINPLEAEYVRKIYECAVERKGFKEILAEMETAGIRGKRGRVMKYPSIYEILRNEKYTGVYLYSATEESGRTERRKKPNGIRVENAIPVIIERTMWEEVQAIMDERKQVGARGGYLCSGLVYCAECGAKMHAHTTHRKGHEYRRYYCSAKCGAKSVNMEAVDKVATDYLQDILSGEKQSEIIVALRMYSAGERNRAEEFSANISAEIRNRQNQIDALVQNLSSGLLPPEAIESIGARIKDLKNEINGLQAATPPKDFSVAQIRAWLESIKAETDEKAVHLLISRINASTTTISIESMLTVVVPNLGCGGQI